MKVEIEIGHLPIGLLADNRALARLMVNGINRALDQRHRINSIADDVLSDPGEVKVSMRPRHARRAK